MRRRTRLVVGSYNTVTSTLSNPSNSAAIKLSGTINPNLLVEASMNYDGNIINIIDSSTGQRALGLESHRLQLSSDKRRPSTGRDGFGNPYGTAEDMVLRHGTTLPRLRAEDGHLVHHGQARHEVGFSYNRYTKNQQMFGDAQGNQVQGQLTNDGLMDVLLGLSSGY